MAYYDFELDKLEVYKPVLPEPDDFDSFWQQTISLSDDKVPSYIKLHKTDYNLTLVNAYDAEFPGFMGHPIKGWFIIPKVIQDPLPCVIEYIGYGGGRGLPFNWLAYANTGYAHFVMDTRGQGSSWQTGDTPDYGDFHSGPEIPGFLTRGIQQKDNYYYRRLICDAVRAVDAVKQIDTIDPEKLAVTGLSQGGALALATAGLRNDIAATMPDVPFLCNIDRAIRITDEYPYQELVSYLKRHRNQTEQVNKVMGYFDGVHFAKRSAAPALFSVALMDTICPPSSVFAAYNWYNGDKELTVYDFNNHEGGEFFQFINKIKFLKKLFT